LPATIRTAAECEERGGVTTAREFIRAPLGKRDISLKEKDRPASDITGKQPGREAIKPSKGAIRSRGLRVTPVWS